MIDFFYNCSLLDRSVLRPLSHIKPNWEISWDDTNNQYFVEEDSFAELLNVLIDDLGAVEPPKKYHDNEDRLAEYCKTTLNWNISKNKRRWIGEDYQSILEQGAFNDIDEKNLILAAAGRIKSAVDLGQYNFDDMEETHRVILAAVLSIILYHRS